MQANSQDPTPNARKPANKASRLKRTSRGFVQKLHRLSRKAEGSVEPAFSAFKRLAFLLKWRRDFGARKMSVRASRGDFEFLSPAAEILDTPPSPIRTILAWTICALVVTAIVISWFGQVDIYAVAAGRIQTAGRSKVIQPLNAGRVRAIYTREGASVRAGAPLLELDPTEVNADQNAAAAHLGALNAEIIRRQAVLKLVSSGDFKHLPAVSFPPGIDQSFQSREIVVMTADVSKLSTTVDYQQAKIGESEAQRQALKTTIASEDSVLSTQSRRVQMRSELLRQGWESEANVLDATETLQRERAAQASDQGQLLQATATIASLKKQQAQTVAQFISDYAGALEKAENDRDSAQQDFVKARTKVGYTSLTAPVDGTVQQMTVTTLGQVVTMGEQLMTIVPKSSHLQIEALIQNQDIGFVKVGQKVVVKIDAFPFTRYGTVSGTVIHVSRDSLQNTQAQAESDTQQKRVSPASSATSPLPQTQQLVFPVTIALDADTMRVDGKQTALSPGMSATIEIKTGHQRVIEYVLAPFITVKSESIHER